MKKTYINPSLTVIEVEDTLVIATSGIGLGDGDAIGNQTPEVDDPGNSFKPGIFGGWDEEE